MLATKNLLSPLPKSRIASIADQFGIDTSNLSKKNLITRISLSLAKRSDDNGNAFGRTGAAKLICEKLTRVEAINILKSTKFYGEEFIYSSSGAVYELNADPARDLLIELAVAENESVLDAICHSKKWRKYFNESEYEGPDQVQGGTSEGEGVDEGELMFGEDIESEPEWLHALSFDAGPAGELPDGLTRTSGSLFDHQRRSVDALVSWWHSDKDKGVLCLPTGAGKTRTAVHFALESVLSEGGKVLWLAHRHELVNQAVAAFLQNGHVAATNFRIGRFEAGTRKLEAPAHVVVASIPTLARAENVDRLIGIHESFSLIIVDECHHAVAPSWKQLLQDLGRVIVGEKLLGLSATPTRTAEGEVSQLWKLFGDIIHEEPLLPLMERGILAHPRVVTVPTNETFEANGEERRLFAKFKDLPPSLVKRIAEDETRNALIASKVVKDAVKWGQTLIFAATIEHARDLVERIRDVGLEAESLDCSAPREGRLAVVERFKTKSLPVLVNVGLFTEGTDLPGVQTVFLARPTMSRILFQQMVGRGLRGPALGGTADCNVVAFYDNVRGLVQDQLASSFSSERSALAAITGEETDDLVESVDKKGDESSTVDARPAEQRMQELIVALRGLDSGGSNVDVSALRLVGWWQAGDAGALRALPVFEDDLENCGAFVARVLHESLANTLSEEFEFDGISVPEAVMRAFVATVQVAPRTTQYCSVIGADKGDLRRLAGAVELDGTAGKMEVPLLARARWLNSPERASKVLLPLNGQSVDVCRRDYDAVGAIWRQMGMMLLGSSPDEQSITRFVAGVLAAKDRFPEMTDVPHSIAESLIRAAGSNGGTMPQPVADDELAAVPPLAEVRKELATLRSEHRVQALREYHQAFFMTQQPDYADFVTALICG
ncbi:DEAD/DEAH box helicase [Myxococcus sp. NMCA1]|uniref:DEAD/DEAH box helicase n=1 Tax=Myxococcus sp. NMCA1 TaxID=2996785 RepID=UPI002286CBB4|nr:DEAD/DEAH box helicase family protein [Myxococcus sp. NMCA1]WAM30046.1 DEAD/DEAH box helicase family protein [Myxococcus sp. NMCA1]